MKMISKYSNWIIIILLCLFLFNGMKSCSRGRKITHLEQIISQKDSLLRNDKDSMTALQNEIRVLQTEKNGYEKNLEVQNEAINQIVTAKKNINVTVKK